MKNKLEGSAARPKGLKPERPRAEMGFLAPAARGSWEHCKLPSELQV